MSYSNIDRNTDQPTTHGRGEGHLGKHDDFSNRTDRHNNKGIIEKAEEKMGMDPDRRHQDHPRTDVTQGRDHHPMQDSRGLYDERDGTQLRDGGNANPFSDRHPAPGAGERLGHHPGHETHHRTHMDDHRGLPGEHGARRDNYDDQERRTFPAGGDTNMSSLDRDNARNLTEPRSGIRDDEQRHRTFPAGNYDTNLDRSAGHVDASGNVTHTRADIRDDENRHRAFPAGEEKNVMSTGSRTTGKVMDEGHNKIGDRDDTDRGHGFAAGKDTHLGSTGRGGTGNVLSHDARHTDRKDDLHTKDTHPHTRHHDLDPRPEGPHRTDDRVLKGDEHHRNLPGAGKEPYYGETRDSKFAAGQHAQPGQGHVAGTGSTTTTGKTTGHAGIGDKIRGTAEQVAGKLMADPVKQQKGTERKQGLLDEPGTTGKPGTGHTGVHDDRY